MHTHFSRDHGKISSIGAGFSTPFSPVDEAKGVLGLPGHAEGVNEASGEHGLLEAVGAPLAVEVGEDQSYGAELVAVYAKGVEEYAELGTLLGGGSAPLNPCEEAAQNTELGFFAHF